MMNVLLRVSDAIDAFRQRAGRNVFWLVLVAALAAVLVVPLYLFQESSSVTARHPVSKGEVRPASPAAGKPAAAVSATAPAAPSMQTAPAPQTPPVVAVPPVPAKAPAAASPARKAPARAAPKPPPAPPLVLSDARQTEAAPAPADAAASAEPERLYQVQLGAFAVEQRAHRLARLAASEGFPAVVMRVTVAGGKVLHRVRLKDSLPRTQAEALQASVKQKIPALEPILAAGAR